VHKNHPLAQESRVNPSQLAYQPLIVTPHGVAPVLRELIDLFLRQHGVEPYYRFETQLQQTIISLVAEGLGVALVPESVKKLHYAEVVYIAIDHSPVIEQVLIWHTENNNPALFSFTEIAQKMADSKGSSRG